MENKESQLPTGKKQIIMTFEKGGISVASNGINGNDILQAIAALETTAFKSKINAKRFSKDSIKVIMTAYSEFELQEESISDN